MPAHVQLGAAGLCVPAQYCGAHAMVDVAGPEHQPTTRTVLHACWVWAWSALLAVTG